jgi:hypothetical protein
MMELSGGDTEGKYDLSMIKLTYDPDGSRKRTRIRYPASEVLFDHHCHRKCQSFLDFCPVP